MIVKSR